MKSNGKKIIIIVSIGIIFMILNISNYNFINYQRNNIKTKQTQNDFFLKTANSEILIITPENKTYTEPMSGYYPATYGFENDKPGELPEDWTFSSMDGSSFIEVDSSLAGHNNIVEIRKTGGLTWARMRNTFNINLTVGIIEFWLYKDTASGTDTTFFTVENTLGVNGHLQGHIEDGHFFYSWGSYAQRVLVASNIFSINTWHHVRLEFNVSLGWQARIDGTLYGSGYSFPFRDYVTGGEMAHFYVASLFSGGNPNYGAWVDAVGYSWDPSYEIGDNLNEGLLLSFENSTALDWMGYSLDGQTNRTIFGNTTITFPIRGSHIIQVFGNDSLGNMYFSPIQYFKIMFDLTETPININGPADWSNIALQPWCSGSGTWSDPYILEYIIIDGQNTDICIEIRNCNVFFIIRHCILYNGVFAGIFLMETTNGQLIHNNISNCGGLYGGIYLYLDCNNHTISGNTLNHNDWSGIHIESTCNYNTISNNIITNSVQYGISLTDTTDYNNVTDNFFYLNNDGAIRITPATSENNRIERNIIVSDNAKYISDAGTNTILISNYYLSAIPSLFVEIFAESFSTSEFFIIINVSSQCIGLEVSFLSIQMWWNGIFVSSDNITDLGNGLYNVSLYPIFVEPGETPILLNMTISASYHKDKYYETYLAVEPPETVKFLQIEITENSYSTDHFNFTFFIFDENNQSVNFAIIQIWWNGTDVSGDVINLGSGLYFVSLEPITVAPGENPILLTMIVSADGYEDKPFETYISVDPNIIDKDGGRLTEEFPLILTIIIASSISGGIGAAGVIMFLLRKRKRINTHA